jgi:Arc/MetJ-type ribon-helix-helix transcriptional regulator
MSTPDHWSPSINTCAKAPHVMLKSMDELCVLRSRTDIGSPCVTQVDTLAPTALHLKSRCGYALRACVGFQSEKITINMSPVDLGKIDLLVEQGHYSNRTDFISTAIRSQLEKHTVEVQQAVSLYSFLVGVAFYNRAHLERLKARHKKLRLTVIGALNLSQDISPALASEVIESVRVRGIFNASEEVKAALVDKIQ